MREKNRPDGVAGSPKPEAGSAPATALPLEPHDGLAPVTGELAAARLAVDPLPRTIAQVALPAVASSLLMTLFTTVDTYWVGTRVGPEGLAAVSTAVFWVWMLVSVAEMVSVGLTAVAARRYGERRSGAAARIAGDALVFTLVLGVVLAVVGLLALDQLFAMMRTPAHVTALGRAYLGTYLLGTPLIFGYFAIDAAFRAAGDTRTPFLILLVSVAATLVIDPMLILGLYGAPKLGIAGAAIATVLTRGTAFLIGLQLAIARGHLRIVRPSSASLPSIAAVVRVGLPTAATGVVFSLIYVAITRTTTQFGTPALAALGIGHRVESWLYMIGVGFAAATAAIVGQNLGAGRPDRAARAGWLATAYCTLLGVVVFALEIAVPEWFASRFTNDPATIAEGARYLRIAAIAQLGVCAEVVLEGALGGAGHTAPPMLTSTALTLARVPLAAWAASRWGSAGIWWVISLTALGRALAMVALWWSGGWKRRSV
ncbi:MAG TPA: MATE family efflux transporter [Gemmatimonadaceae bacterium]|nr:MATE family efflux transporter [Gemmatimonadaceae bacterium]